VAHCACVWLVQDMEDSGDVPGARDVLEQSDPIDPCRPVMDVSNTQDESYVGSWVSEVSVVHKGRLLCWPSVLLSCFPLLLHPVLSSHPPNCHRPVPPCAFDVRPLNRVDLSCFRRCCHPSVPVQPMGTSASRPYRCLMRGALSACSVACSCIKSFVAREPSRRSTPLILR
jgi:hypothetical protein